MRKSIALLMPVVLLLGCLLMSCGTGNFVYHIFADIEECKNFELNKSEGAEVVQYESPAADEALQDLPYSKFWAGSYTSPELTFEIFAYEFADNDTAMTYFENETGARIENKETVWRLSGGVTSSRLIVIDGKNAYIAHTATAEVDAMREFLKKSFTKELDFGA